MMMARPVLFFLLGLFCVFIECRQNREAEAHCQGFLTDKETAPISPVAQRVLAVDNEAEAWCRQVLADDDLPLNIRGVVLEGLSHLLMQHTYSGLADRGEDALKIHQELVMLFPESPRFLVQAALHASKIGKVNEAIAALSARLEDTDSSSVELSELQETGRRLLDDLKRRAHENSPGSADMSEL